MDQNRFYDNVLATGSHRQQQAHSVLNSLHIQSNLRPFTPALIGTIPLNIDIPSSDLDIACFAPDLARFQAAVQQHYSLHPGFRLREKLVRAAPSVICNFEYGGFPIQLFAQPQPVEQQYGYRHLLIEARLLALGGEAARQAIRALKLAGFKTEPAFARYFGLSGDPYEQLWQLSFAGDTELRAAVAGSI